MCSSEEDVSALQFASIIGHTKIAELLITAGCSIDHYSFDGFTALHCAAKYGHVDTTRLLVRRGCVSLPQTANLLPSII